MKLRTIFIYFRNKTVANCRNDDIHSCSSSELNIIQTINDNPSLPLIITDNVAPNDSPKTETKINKMDIKYNENVVDRLEKTIRFTRAREEKLRRENKKLITIIEKKNSIISKWKMKFY